MSGASHLGERAAALVDGELDHDARDRTLGHLTSCDSCRAEIDAMRRLKAQISALSGPGPSADLIRRLLAVGAPSNSGTDDRLPELGDDPDESGASGYGALLGHAALLATAVLQRSRPAAVGRARAAVRAGVRLAATRPSGRPASASRPEAVRPRQRARLAAVGCFSIMVVAMGTAFTMGGQPSGQPSPTPIVDRAGVEYASTLSGPGSSSPVDPARKTDAQSNMPAEPSEPVAPLDEAAVLPVVQLAAYVEEVGPDTGASTFAGAEYLSSGDD